MSPHRVIDLAAARAALRITRFVDDYERRHPPLPQSPIAAALEPSSADARTPEGPEYRDHPAVRACIGRAHAALLEFLGGPGPAWDQLIHAAQYWFAPDDDSLPYLCLRGQFQVAQGFCGGDARLQAAVTRYRAWRGLPLGTRILCFPGGEAVRVAVPPD